MKIERSPRCVLLGFLVPALRCDVGGRVVRTLVDGDRTGGIHSTVWDGRSDAGHEVASGVYFCRIEIGAWSSARKMVLVR